MNTELLRYLVEYAACGSAQRTANRLGVNRSSVTRNIKKLETELGTKLFVNTLEGVVPTHSGDVCLRYAKEILRAEEDLRFDFAGSRGYSTTIDIGMGPTRSRRILPMVLPVFSRLYPNVSVQLHELSSADSTVALLNQRLDFAVISQPVGIESISFEPMLTERLVLVAPQGDSFIQQHAYRNADIDYVSLEYFEKASFILGYSDQKSRKESRPIFKKAGYEPKVVFQTRDSYTAAMLAYNGLGYALVPESCVPPMVPYYRMIPGLDVSWTIGIATLGKNSLSHASEQLKLLMLQFLGDNAIHHQANHL